MASYDRAIPPGEEGKIVLTVDTKGYERNIHKTAYVHTNDPNMPKFIIGIRAFVQVPVFVTPRYTFLKGAAERPVTRTVKIEAGLGKPLELRPDKFSLAERLNYEIEEVEKGRFFLVRLTTIVGKPGNFSGYLNLKTNYEEQPIINIPIRGRLSK